MSQILKEAIDTISDHEWQEAIAAHLAWGETWHGDLPADVFFSIWAGLTREARPPAYPRRPSTSGTAASPNGEETAVGRSG